MPHPERSEPIAAPDNLWRSNAEVGTFMFIAGKWRLEH